MDQLQQDPNRMRKYHEGWAYHQTEGKKGWTKYWLVLRGNILFIFTNDNTHKSNMRGTLSLTPETELKNLSESKKKSLKFELTTMSPNMDRKINRFKFDKEIDHDVWKSFIIGISVGIVPSDVHLLPGQLKDVHVAMDEVRNTPPPLPTIPRPTIPRPTVYRSPAINGYNTTSTNQDELDNDSDGSGSFRSRFTTVPRSDVSMNDIVPPAAPPVSMGVPPESGGGAVNNLRQLMHRQASLTDRMLESPSAVSPPSARHQQTVTTHYAHDHQTYDRQRSSHDTKSYDARSHDVSYDERSRFGGVEMDDRSVDTGFDEDPFNNNSMSHLFHLDPERNSDVPSWFFDSCDRLEAENILTCGRRYGNVLMRPSSTFTNTGKYVISMRREISGGTTLNHYEVIKHNDGYKINVDNKHSAMRCLSDVMDFFVSVAGPGTKPLRSNDLSKLFGSTLGSASLKSTRTNRSSHIDVFGQSSLNDLNVEKRRSHYRETTSPPTSPTVAPSYRKSSLGDSNRSISPPPAPAWPTSPAQSSSTQWSSSPSSAGGGMSAASKLHIQGNVGLGIRQAIGEMNTDYGTRSYGTADDGGGIQDCYNYDEDETGVEYYNDVKGQSTGADTEVDEIQENWSFGNGDGVRNPRLSQTVPAKTAPSETLKRQAGHSEELTSHMQNVRPGDSVPPPPAFLPPAAPPMAPPMAPPAAPPAPPLAAVPPPPPIPPPGGIPPPPAFSPGAPPAPPMNGGGGFPAPPKFNSATVGRPYNDGGGDIGSAYSRQQSEPSQGGYGGQNESFNTAPARRVIPPRQMTLEDQLKARLVSQREQIYADGAVVLKNY